MLVGHGRLVAYIATRAGKLRDYSKSEVRVLASPPIKDGQTIYAPEGGEFLARADIRSDDVFRLVPAS